MTAFIAIERMEWRALQDKTANGYVIELSG